jgi:ElaB/YqjD/DUF883 family membrane-anchored ribosome-binding protein
MTKTNDPDEGLTEAAPSQSAPSAPDPSREKDPERIREGIEQTREELGETVDALAAKADIKAQAKQRADERKQALRNQQERAQEALRKRQQRAQEKASAVRERMSNATPEDAKEIAGRAAAAAERRPLPAIGGALIVGVFLGWALGRR